MAKAKKANKSKSKPSADTATKSLSVAEQPPQPIEDEQAIEAEDEISPATKALFQSYDVPLDEFIERKDEEEEKQSEVRSRLVYARSIESCVGYSSLLRLLSNHYIEQVAFYRSDEGGVLPIEEARARAYRPCDNEEEAISYSIT